MEVSQKLKIELPYGPTLLDMHPKKKKKKNPLTQKDTSTQIFIAALFSIAKIGRQPKCPSTDG